MNVETLIRLGNEKQIDDAYFEGTCPDFFNVDWREYDDEIVKLCESVIKTGKLSASMHGSTLTIKYGDKQSQLELPESTGARHDTICALNDILNPDYEVRYFLGSHGSDVIGLCVLQKSLWQQLEKECTKIVESHFRDPRNLPNIITELTESTLTKLLGGPAEPGDNQVDVRRSHVYDKAKYHIESIEQHGLPIEQIYVHSGLYLGWLIENKFLEREFYEEMNDVINMFMRREITAPELFSRWDGVLVDDMLSDEGNRFSHYYFDFAKGQYLDDYVEKLAKDLPSEFHVIDNWENYDKAKEFIEARYQRWKTITQTTPEQRHRNYDKAERKRLKNQAKEKIARDSAELSARYGVNKSESYRVDKSIARQAKKLSRQPARQNNITTRETGSRKTIYIRAILEIIVGVLGYALAYKYMAASEVNTNAGFYTLIGIAAPGVLILVGVLEAVTGMTFLDLSNKWDVLPAWNKCLISLFTVSAAIMLLLLAVYLLQ